jgi:LPXTG-motif cell wall-anchored protein
VANTSADTSADTGSNTMIWYLVGGVVLLGLVGFLGAGMRSRGGGTDAS